MLILDISQIGNALVHCLGGLLKFISATNLYRHNCLNDISFNDIK